MTYIRLSIITLLLLACAKPEPAFTIKSAKWEIQNSNHTGSTRGISAVNENLAWMSSSRGIYAVTEDAGKTWLVDSLVPEDSLQFRDIEAFSRDVVYMMSIGSGETSRIYKTTDGGKNWQLQIKNEHPEGFYDGFAFWDENNAILIGDPVGGKHFVMKMTDGETWQQIDPDKLAPLAEGEIGGFAASGTTIAVYGDNVWFGTGGTTARLHHSPDRGESWQVYDTPMMDGAGSTGIFSLDFRDDLHGVMVGGDYTKQDLKGYTVATTADGGKTWQALADTSVVSFRSCVQYIPHTTSLVAVGRGGVSSFSNDDGKTWTNFGETALYTMSFSRHGKSAWGAGPRGATAKLVLE